VHSLLPCRSYVSGFLGPSVGGRVASHRSVRREPSGGAGLVVRAEGIMLARVGGGWVGRVPGELEPGRGQSDVVGCRMLDLRFASSVGK
jgi:hypothetical protein